MNEKLLKVAKFLLESGFKNEAAQIKKLASTHESEKEVSDEFAFLNRNLFVSGIMEQYLIDAFKEECKRKGYKGFYNNNNGIYAVLSVKAGYCVYKPEEYQDRDDMDEWRVLGGRLESEGYIRNEDLPVRSHRGQSALLADFNFLMPEKPPVTREEEWKRLHREGII
jgi:hypothetical protein